LAALNGVIIRKALEVGADVAKRTGTPLLTVWPRAEYQAEIGILIEVHRPCRLQASRRSGGVGGRDIDTEIDMYLHMYLQKPRTPRTTRPPATLGARAPTQVQRSPSPQGCACGGTCPRCNASQPQAKLAVSTPGDKYEREADRVAEAIVGGSGAAVPRASVSPPAPQRMARAADGVGGNSGVVDEAARGLGGGSPLDGTSRGYFERRLGHDLSDVRIHTGAAAAQSATALSARAYTMGRNIVFGAGEYAPGSPSGRRLLAHELVHVVQQGAAAPRAAAGETAPPPSKPLAAGAYSLRLIDEQGGEKFIGPPMPEAGGMPVGADGEAAPPPRSTAPEEESPANVPVQRMPKQGATPTVFIQRAATFTKPVPKAEDPLVRVMKGLTPGLTTPAINGTRAPSADQLLAALSPTKVKETGSSGGNVTCQFDGFNVATTAEEIVATAAPAGGWTATIGPASAISSDAKCAKVATLPITMKANPSNADFVKRVQQSEDEHVTDLKGMHDRYLVPYEAFVSGVGGSGKDLPACGQNLVSQLGFRHTETAFEFSHGWATMLERLDGALGTHTDTANITTNKDCSAATLTIAAATAQKAGAGPGNVAVVNPTTTAFTPGNLKVVGNDLKDGKTVVKSFGSAADATAALAVIQHYGMTSRNVIGPLEYWLVGAAAPSGTLKGANEFAIDPKGHQVTFNFPNAGEWAITDITAVATGVNVNVIASFGAKRDEAYSAWSILLGFGFTQRAWVGGTRDKPAMMYFRV
jgi:hypothetical protein